MSKDPIETAEVLAKEINTRIEEHGRGVFERYPLTFALLATFGVTAIGAGFKGIIEDIPTLYNNPFVLLALGIVVLLATGSLYKRLQK